MSEQLTVFKEQFKSLPEIIDANLPRLILGNQKAIDLMNSMVAPENDEQYDKLNNQLVSIKKTYDAMNTLRKQITSELDRVKQDLMSYEEPLNPDKDASMYSQKRKLLSDYQQKKLEESKRVAKEAAAKLAMENKKVEISQKVRTNLSDFLIARLKKADDSSRGYFEKATIDTIDELEKRYKAIKPKLEQKEYDDCFMVGVTYTQEPELIAHIENLKKEEPYEKWNEILIEKAAPILNEWRAKVPFIREELKKQAEAKSEEEKARLEQERLDREAADAKAKQEQFQKMQDEQKQALQEQADIDKMHNSFQEQATVQMTEDAGPTKKILKFVDPKKPQPLIEIILQCFAHPKFPGIIKLDKSKRPVVDEKGRPEYVPAVQWWVQFFQANCDADVKGTHIEEDVKLIVRAK